MAQFPVGEIDANPFRHIDRYPIRRDKVTALRESIRTTGVWPTLVGRKQEGRVQLAFGHHRKVAITEELGAKAKIEIAILPLDDEAMLQMMARENMEEWGTSAMVEHETVRAVVEAYAEGKITLEPPAGNDRYFRYAPSFVQGLAGVPRASPYNATTVGRFLGWIESSGRPQAKVEDALAALQFVEEGVLSEADFEGLSGTQAAVVVDEARRVRAAQEERARHAESEAKEARKRAERAEHEREQARARADVDAERRARQEQQEAERVSRSRDHDAKKQREHGQKQATRVGRHVSGAMRSGKIGTRQARQEAAKIVRPEERSTLPNADTFMRRLASDLGRILDPDNDPRTDKLDQLVRLKTDLPPFERNDLVKTLEKVAGRFAAYADKLTVTEVPKRAEPRHDALTGGR